MSKVIQHRPGDRLSTPLMTVARAILQRFISLGDSSTPLLTFIPKPVKLLLLFILLLNSPSWPFLWHLRVWRTPIKAYWARHRYGTKKYLDDWHKRVIASGGVGGTVTRLKRLAWVDDCDYNLHLSNSSYGKSLDASRMDWCMEVIFPFLISGAYAALGASHYTFFKEIPLGSEYFIETRCGGWGDKWLYLVTEFVIYPKKSDKSGHSRSNGSAASSTVPAGPSLSIPSTSDLLPSSESSTTTSASVSGSNTPISADQVKKATQVKARAIRQDGGVVCCMAVSEYCFKADRVTIPPRIALYHSMQSPKKAEQIHARTLIESKDSGKKWLKSGWKDEVGFEQLGRDIGVVGGFGERVDSGGGGEGDEWVVRRREAMARVIEGLSEM